jgi:hypothetical protein
MKENKTIPPIFLPDPASAAQLEIFYRVGKENLSEADLKTYNMLCFLNYLVLDLALHEVTVRALRDNKHFLSIMHRSVSPFSLSFRSKRKKKPSLLDRLFYFLE